jgi:hypothetical protein
LRRHAEQGDNSNANSFIVRKAPIAQLERAADFFGRRFRPRSGFEMKTADLGENEEKMSGRIK